MGDEWLEIDLATGNETDSERVVAGLKVIQLPASHKRFCTYTIAERSLEADFLREEEDNGDGDIGSAHADLDICQDWSIDLHAHDLTCTKVPPALTMKQPVWIETSAPLASMTRSIWPGPESTMPNSFFIASALRRE
jgi:hypothetical protein